MFSLKNQSVTLFPLITYCLILFVFFCQSGDTDNPLLKSKDLTDQLSKGADIETIAEHLIKVRKAVGVTRALAIHYPNLDRETAFQIQMTMLEKLEKNDEKLAGWKMSGTRVADPDLPFNPTFGFILKSDNFPTGSTISSSKFVSNSPLVEAEVGFVLKKDLLGSKVTRDELIDAIEGVGGFSELISIRTRDAKGGTNVASAHFIADGLSHGGFIRPTKTLPLQKIDLTNIQAKVSINGEVKAAGHSKEFALLDAVLFLANNLPIYGRNLRAGDFVITGSILKAPPAQVGDKTEIEFSSFDSLNIEFK